MSRKKAYVNRRGLEKEIAPKIRGFVMPLVRQRVQRAIERAREQLIEDFAHHLITQEVKAGPKATNISNTLGGYGNLFSYIGFEEGSDPIPPIKKYLSRALRLERITTGQGFGFIVKIALPNKDEVEALSPVPWAPGRSWVDAMERGLSGLGQYLKVATDAGRSGGAIQTTVDLRAGSFQRQAYLSPMLAALEGNLLKAMRL